MRKIFTLFSLTVVFIIGCESSNLVDPSTVISYTIEEKAHVKLNVENSYNTIIKTLVDEEQNAGIYSVSFAVNNLAEGVYFYIIEAKGIESNYYYKSTKHLFLVK